MMIRLAFHMFSNFQAMASWSPLNTHWMSPFGPLTKPSSDMDMVRINFLTALSSQEFRRIAGLILRFDSIGNPHSLPRRTAGLEIDTPADADYGDR
jgi:hypothetical protein